MILSRINGILKNKKTTLKILILRGLGILIIFLMTLFLTNNFSPKIVGQFDFVRTFILVLSSIVLLGTDQSILYFSGLLKSQNNFIYIKIVYLKILKIILLISISLIIVFCFFGKSFSISFFGDIESHYLVSKSIFFVFFYSLTILNSEVLRALDKNIISEFLRNILKFGPFILGAIFLVIYNNKELLIDVFLLSFIATSVITSFLVFHFLKDIKIINKDFFSILYIIKKSTPFAISGAAIYLLLSIDIFLLKKYEGDEVVAYYSVAIKLITIISTIINSININISSSIAEFFESKKFTELNNLMKKTSRTIFFITIPFIICIFFLSKDILIFFGKGYISSNESLLIMITAQTITTAFGATPVYLNMTGRQKLFQNILIITVIINLTTNLILIPIYGMIGASISFAISLLFWNIISAFFIFKKDYVNVLLR